MNKMTIDEFIQELSTIREKHPNATVVLYDRNAKSAADMKRKPCIRTEGFERINPNSIPDFRVHPPLIDWEWCKQIVIY